MTEAQTAILAAATWATAIVTIACLMVAVICIMSLLTEVLERRRKRHGDVFTYNRFWRKRK